MKKYTLIILSLFLFFSCQKEKNTDQKTIKDTITTSQKQQKDTNTKKNIKELNETDRYYLDSVFYYSMNKSLNPFKFMLRRFIEYNEKDHFNFFYDITIIDTTTKNTVQIIDSSYLEGLVQINFDDYNFDGFTDMYIADRCAILGNCFGKVFLYNNENNQFDLAHEFDELTSIEADKKNKFIHSLNRSAAGVVFTATTLQYIDGKLTIIELKEQDYADGSTNKYRYTLKKRDKNGNLKTIKEEILKEPRLE